MLEKVIAFALMAGFGLAAPRAEQKTQTRLCFTLKHSFSQPLKSKKKIIINHCFPIEFNTQENEESSNQQQQWLCISHLFREALTSGASPRRGVPVSSGSGMLHVATTPAQPIEAMRAHEDQ